VKRSSHGQFEDLYKYLCGGIEELSLESWSNVLIQNQGILDIKWKLQQLHSDFQNIMPQYIQRNKDSVSHTYSNLYY
jgi:hypothetical protein